MSSKDLEQQFSTQATHQNHLESLKLLMPVFPSPINSDLIALKCGTLGFYSILGGSHVQIENHWGIFSDSSGLDYDGHLQGAHPQSCTDYMPVSLTRLLATKGRGYVLFVHSFTKGLWGICSMLYTVKVLKIQNRPGPWAHRIYSLEGEPSFNTVPGMMSS